MRSFIAPVSLAILTLVAAAIAGCTTAGPPPREVPENADPLVKRFPQWMDAEALTPSVEAGKAIFHERTFGSKMACVNCHGFDAADTLTTDADGLVRAGVSVWASVQRTNVKGQGSYIATLGGNMCVHEWQDGPREGLTAQELRDLDAYLKTGGGGNHPTAANIDYSGRTFTIPKVLTGGDAARGHEMTLKYCNACHDVDDTPKRFGAVKPKLKPAVASEGKLKRIAERIRDHYDANGERDNKFMPGFSDQRLPEQDLLDILAWLEKK